ncbi:MAG: acyltransferase family protein [Prevotella sp.]|nr:acyltransferase family protein [Prevotella sp.]
MKDNNNDRRIKWADLARGLAIFLVLLGHANPPSCMLTFIYAFHMPLFFILSGLFMKVDDWSSAFIKKKIRTLLVPFIIYNIILLFSDYCIVTLSPNKHDAIDLTGRLCGILTGWHGTTFNSALWFLPCLFMAQLMVVAGYHIARKNRRYCAFIWGSYSFLGISYCTFIGFPLPMSTESALIATGFLLIGYHIKKINPITRPWWFWHLLSMTFILATIGNALILSEHFGQVDISTDTLGNPLLFYLAACTGSLLVIKGCQCVEMSFGNTFLNKVLLWLGRNSLIIYCIHRIPMNLGIGLMNATYITPTKLSPEFLLIRAVILVAFTLILLIPGVAITNRWFAWTLGKAITK